MKYIRTKDGRIYDTIEDEKIRLERNDKTHEIIFLLLPSTNTLNMPICLNVIAQADTIEELCDKFIGVEENGTPHIFAYECDLLNLIHNTERRFGTKVTGYGSIWVDGNLIKVAKMNSKGELELL